MTQDTGKIVSWLKQSGDPVKTGDAIMEVETDKATMEVEAQANGFLTGIKASAGDDVPVGQIVATISETADEPATPSQVTANETQDAAPFGDDLPKGKSIIMPALGMAQDTGLIVAWRKSPGDKVTAGDVLLEVETDKSVMEVEAGHDGFVAAILAQAQEAVPVGSVIAIISDVAPENPISRGLAAVSAPTAKAAPEAPPAKAPEPKPKPANKAAPQQAPQATQPTAGGRILASPKAKRLAREQGLDLSRLAAQGIAQPFHVADLETLRALPPVNQAGNTNAPAAAILHIAARVPASGCDDFIQWFADDGKIAIEPASLWARFAAAALRSARQSGSDSLVLGIDRPNSDPVNYADPDMTRLSDLEPMDADRSADLTLRDLTGSLLTAVRLTADAGPVLTIGRDGTAYVLGLDFMSGQLAEQEAIAFLTDFAGRLNEPLSHIL